MSECVGYLHHHFRVQAKKSFQGHPLPNFGVATVLSVLNSKERQDFKVKISFYLKFCNFIENKTWLPYYTESFLGTKARAVKETVCTPSRGSTRGQEWYDAEIARKLQEEELLVSRLWYIGSGG